MIIVFKKMSYFRETHTEVFRGKGTCLQLPLKRVGEKRTYAHTHPSVDVERGCKNRCGKMLTYGEWWKFFVLFLYFFYKPEFFQNKKVKKITAGKWLSGLDRDQSRWP